MGAMTMIKIPVTTGPAARLPGPARGSGSGPAPTGVIVAHELFGVNPDIRGVADDLAGAGYLAIAPEFYHRDAAPGRWLGARRRRAAGGLRLPEPAGARPGGGRRGGGHGLAEVAAGDRAGRGGRVQRRRAPGLPGGLPAPGQPDRRAVRRLADQHRHPDEPPHAHAGADPGDHRPDPLPGRRGRHADRRRAARADPRGAGGRGRRARGGQLPRGRARVLLAGHAAVQRGGQGRRVGQDPGPARERFTRRQRGVTWAQQFRAIPELLSSTGETESVSHGHDGMGVVREAHVSPPRLPRAGGRGPEHYVDLPGSQRGGHHRADPRYGLGAAGQDRPARARS